MCAKRLPAPRHPHTRDQSYYHPSKISDSKGCEMVTLASDAIKWGTGNQKYPPGRQKNLKSQPGVVAQALIPSTREAEISGSLEFPDSQDSIIKRPCLWGEKKRQERNKGWGKQSVNY